MSRYFLEIAFDGTNFHGWQVQENANTVQQELNKALATILQSEIETTGCGRTDTGVHATQFFVHFDCDPVEDEQKFVFRLNGILPESIGVKRMMLVDDEAHARFDATSRTYHYKIHSGKDPFSVNRSMFLAHLPDLDAMNAAAKALFDFEDFTSFSKSNTQTYTNNCKVSQAEWSQKDNELTFVITADRFLRNMVRAIVGTLLEVGQGQLDKEGFRKIIESKDRKNAGQSVPACGLYLANVVYPYINEA